MSLRQLVQKRDAKRKRCSDLFEEKQALEARKNALDAEMEALQEELMQIDEHIESLEDGATEQQPLTMNPEEILPEEPSAASFAARKPPAAPLTIDDDDDDDNDNGDPITQQIVVDSSPEAAVARRPPPQRASLAPLFLQNNHPSSSTAPRPACECPFTTDQITQVLRSTFQIQNFREHQLEIIQTTTSGQDCFVIMRTGGGKSLTYQLPVILERPKITLVISPLLSLIQDQQEQMNQFLPNCCVSFTSGMGAAEHTENWKRVRDPNGGVGMILVTPEKVHKSNKLRSELEKLFEQDRLARFVIDECHCACQWGTYV
jgi:hypothetical protein